MIYLITVIALLVLLSVAIVTGKLLKKQRVNYTRQQIKTINQYGFIPKAGGDVNHYDVGAILFILIYFS
jgi:hypothetical protein